MRPQLNANRTRSMHGVAFFIRQSPVLMRGAVASRRFVGPLVSRCGATHFRLLVQTKADNEKDTRHSAGHTSPRHVCVAALTESNTGRVTRSHVGWLRPQAVSQQATTLSQTTRTTQVESDIRAAFFVGLRCANPTYNNRDLERAPARLPVFIPLGVAPSSGGGKRKKTAGCLSAASFRPSRLPPEPRRESMRSIGARQGALLLVTSLGQAREVTRTAVRNPKSKFTCPVDPEL